MGNTGVLELSHLSISIIFSVNNDSYSHIIFATEKVFALS